MAREDRSKLCITSLNSHFAEIYSGAKCWELVNASLVSATHSHKQDRLSQLG